MATHAIILSIPISAEVNVSFVAEDNIFAKISPQAKVFELTKFSKRVTQIFSQTLLHGASGNAQLL